MWYQVQQAVQAAPIALQRQPVIIEHPSVWSQVHDALVGSMSRVLVKLSSFLPAVLALVLALVIFSLLGAGLAWAVRRVLTNLRFDERMGRDNSAGVSDWSPAHSPTLLISRIVFWVCVIMGAAVGFSAFDAAYSNSNFEISALLWPYLAHSVGAIVILLVGNLLARFLARSVLIGAVNARLQYARLLSLGVKWLVLVFTGAMVLDHLQVGGVVVELAFGILFGGMVLTLALAVGLGSREIVSRSLERTAGEKATPEVPVPQKATTSEETPRNLRHF